jgi:hypothetical protein
VDGRRTTLLEDGDLATTGLLVPVRRGDVHCKSPSSRFDWFTEWSRLSPASNKNISERRALPANGIVTN